MGTIFALLLFGLNVSCPGAGCEHICEDAYQECMDADRSPATMCEQRKGFCYAACAREAENN